MVGRDWSEVVEEAVRRHVDSTGDPVFTRLELTDAELNRIVSETGSEGATPHQTLSRELQQLRDAGVIEFVDDRGTYRLIN
jgi:putative restriction endonuclease